MKIRSDMRVHFIGIGGAGMSAIAKVLLERGVTVGGSDLKRSRVLAALEAMGATIHIGHEGGNVGDADLVVFSSAIPAKNPEMVVAAERSIPRITRGEALAAILNDHRSVVVAGTHGKTTTTSMIVTILTGAGLDPTYLVGAGLNDSGTNARSGLGDVAVAESDESDGSFLLLHPHVGVITNVELDHVDHWGSFEELLAAFESFVSQIDPAGVVVVPAADDRLVALALSGERRVLTFGEGGDVHAGNVAFGAGVTTFELVTPDGSPAVELHVPGAHNVANALAAAAGSLAVGVEAEAVARGLAAYRGVERRFQVKGSAKGITVIDDYAHHPTEISATLEAARPGPWRRVVAVFQPHRYSRTAALAAGFGGAFGGADRVVLMDVYGAGEEPVPGVSGKIVADAICRSFPGRPVAYFPHRGDVVSYLMSSLRRGDVVLTLGAGDVGSVGEEILDRLGTS